MSALEQITESLRRDRLSKPWAAFVRQNPIIAPLVTDYLYGGGPRPSDAQLEPNHYAVARVLAEDTRRSLIAALPDPQPLYTYRMATFEPATDPMLYGTLNVYLPNTGDVGSNGWWVPGNNPGDPWPDGGGLFEINTPHGPGLRIVCTDAMNYVGATPLGTWTVGRFAMMYGNTDETFRDKEQVWEWTYMQPSAGNPQGWPNAWVTCEGLTFATKNPQGSPSVGHHLFLDYGPPLRVRFGRQDFVQASGNSWQFTFGPAFPADTYVHHRLEIKWSASADGYIRCYADSGTGFKQWVNFSGVTLPTGWNVWTVYQNVRRQKGLTPRNTLDVINHRLTIL